MTLQIEGKLETKAIQIVWPERTLVRKNLLDRREKNISSSRLQQIVLLMITNIFNNIFLKTYEDKNVSHFGLESFI